MKTEALQDAIKQYHVWNCLDCGKCSALCPITTYEGNGYSSPRLLVDNAVAGRREGLIGDSLFWNCLTCKRCSDLCPVDVDFSRFLREIRSLARSENNKGNCTHGAIFQTLGQMMIDPAMKQNRLDWLNDDLKVSETSDTVYFVGCAPYYAVVFKELDVETLEICEASIKVLNHLGIEPQVIASERCCGHDQLWQGDFETFHRLAELNIEQLKSAGAKRVITSCPECARTLKMDYPEFVSGHNFEVKHILELVDESDLLSELPEGEGGTQANVNATYQDPCRLGRHMGIFDAPRNVASGLGFSVIEMERAHRTSQCCGTSCWTACGQTNKYIQVTRLREAKATGADLLITSCVKCQIHFECAKCDPIQGNDLEIDIRDLITIVAERI